jgi:SAM-dependent methyltransferase
MSKDNAGCRSKSHVPDSLHMRQGSHAAPRQTVESQQGPAKPSGCQGEHSTRLTTIVMVVLAADNRKPFNRVVCIDDALRIIPLESQGMTALSPTETYLQDFHQRQPGATSAAFAHLRARSPVAEYASSYAALAACVPEARAALTVLDLACGDGHLLKLLADRQNPSLRLIGVDMSQGELDVARAALPADVVLLKERAQALSIETASVDCVLSHMAIMLMDNIDHVIAEIRRVLRSQGQFSTVIGRTFLLGEVNDVLLKILVPILKEDVPRLPFGDARTRTEDGMTELLARDFTNLQFEDLDVEWEPHPNELWDSLTETYDIDRLSAPAKERLRERFLEALSGLLQSDGTIRTGWGVRLIRAQAK